MDGVAQQCLTCGALLCGTLLGGRFRIERLLGRGGMGAVYQATDITLDRQVAAKVLTPTGSLVGEAPAGLRQRFFREARLAAQLDHPNIVPVLHFEQAGPFAYLVMPLLTGGTLASYLARHQRPAPATVLGWLRQLAAALDYAHQRPQPIVHRDVKPGNLLFHEDGRLCLADFGIAQMMAEVGDATQVTSTGVVLGSLAYLAPEQISGHAVPASDQYNVGVILYEALTGALPFSMGDPYVVLHQHLAALPVPPSLVNPALPPGVDAVVLRALAKDPQARFPTLGALAAAFAAALPGAAAEMSALAAGAPPDTPEAAAAFPLAEDDPRGEFPTQADLSLRSPVRSAPGDTLTAGHRRSVRGSPGPMRRPRLARALLTALIALVLCAGALGGLKALSQMTHAQRAANAGASPASTAPGDSHLAALLAAEQHPLLLQDPLHDNHLHWSLGPGAHFTMAGLQLATAGVRGSNQTSSQSSATQGDLHLPARCDIELDLTAQGGALNYGLTLLSLVPPSLAFRFSTTGSYQVSWYAGNQPVGAPSQGQAAGLALAPGVRAHLAILLQGNQVALFLNTGAGIRWIATLSSPALFRGAQALLLLNFGSAAAPQASLLYSNLRIYQA